jgi:hypothetical protein
MTGSEEHAAGPRGLSTFPRSWGAPPGSPMSEERAAWVRSHVRSDRDPRLALVRALALADDHPTPPGPAGESFDPAELEALLKWWRDYMAGWPEPA